MAEKRLINYDDDEESQEYNEQSRPRIGQSPLSSSAAAISSMYSPVTSPPTLSLQPITNQNLSDFRLPPARATSPPTLSLQPTTATSPLSTYMRPYLATRQTPLRPGFLEPPGSIENNFATAILATNQAVTNLFQSGLAQGRRTTEIRDDARTLLSLAGQVVAQNTQIMDELLAQRDQREIEAQARREEQQRQQLIETQTSNFLAESSAIFNSGGFQELSPEQQQQILKASLILLQRNITRYGAAREQQEESQLVTQNISGLFNAVIQIMSGILSDVRENATQYAQNTLYGFLAVVLAGSYLPSLQTAATPETGIIGLLIRSARIAQPFFRGVRDISVPSTVIFLLLRQAGFEPQISRLGEQCSNVGRAIGTGLATGFQQFGRTALQASTAVADTCRATSRQVQDIIGDALARMSGNYFVSDIVDAFGRQSPPSVASSPSTVSASIASSTGTFVTVQSIRNSVITRASIASVPVVVDQQNGQPLLGDANGQLEAILLPMAQDYPLRVLNASQDSSIASSILGSSQSNASSQNSENNGFFGNLFGNNYGGKLRKSKKSKQTKQTRKQRKTKKRQLKLKGGRRTRRIRRTRKSRRYRR